MKKAFHAVVALLLIGPLLRADQPTTRPISEVAKPSLITLSVKNATVKSVLDSMEKQSKLKPVIAGGQQGVLDAPITLELDNVPWIEAFIRLCQAANLNPINYGDRWTLNPHGDQQMLGPRDAKGATLVVLTNAALETNTIFGPEFRSSRQLTLSGLLAVEPSLDIDSVSGLTDLRVIDDQDRELPVTSRGSSSAAMGNFRRDFSITVEMPDNTTKQLKSVRGTLIAPVLADRQQLAIPNLLVSEGTKYPIGKGHATVGGVRSRGQLVSEVDIRFDQGVLPPAALARLRSNASRHLPRQTHATDPANLRGQRINERDGAVVFTLFVQFHRQPKDADDANDAVRVVNLAWDLPVNYFDVAIPFEIKDIPLP